MPLIQGSASLLTATVNDNVLTGSQFEYLPWNAALNFGLVASATGLVVDVYSGQDTLCESLLPSLQNRFPVFPDDFNLTDVAAAGERIKIRVRNTSGGTLTFFYAVQLNPI
jgi:hypothetical protein